MVLQLTDFTSEITDEELREFTSEYYIPSALHPCYTEKLDALRRWREMFFWVDDALVPWNFAFYTQGLLPRDERPPPGSYSMEDAELINENRIPINAYSEAFLCHMGISRNYFQRPEEVPTFIGDDGREMDLFSVVHLSKPKQVIEGVRPLRDGEEPLLESTAGRTMELVLEQPEIESTDVLAPTPLRSVPSITVEPPMPDATSIGSSEDADVAEVDSGLKRKRATGDDGAGPSKRVRHLSLGLSTSTKEYPCRIFNLCSVIDRGTPVMCFGSHALLPPMSRSNVIPLRPVTHCCTVPHPSGSQGVEGISVDQLMEEFDMECTGRMRDSAAEDTLLADAQVESESSMVIIATEPLAEEKMALLVRTTILRAGSFFRESGGGVGDSRRRNYRKLQYEYGEGALPSHGVRRLLGSELQVAHKPMVCALLAMSTLVSQEVTGYNHNAYEVLVVAMEAMNWHATEGAEAQPDYFLKPDVAQLQVPIFACPRDILNPFALEKESQWRCVTDQVSELLGSFEEAGDAGTKLAVQREVVVTVSRLSSLSCAGVVAFASVIEIWLLKTCLRVVILLACTVFDMARVVVLLACTVFGMQGLWSCPNIRAPAGRPFSYDLTDEELREFTSEYYIPSALHPVVPAADASIADFPVGKVGCYTEKLDALRRWREMFFWVDDALVPWNFAFYTQG
ncbi:hypothetical protein Tco_1394209 [Tanacetum coccineum]